MTDSDDLEPGSPEDDRAGRGVAFESVLFEGAGPPDTGGTPEPDYFGDLNLDQVVAALTAGREEYALEPFFYRPLHATAGVRYRHEVLRDLERPEVLSPVAEFARELRRMREHLVQVEKLHYAVQQQMWFLDAAGIYCGAVTRLAAELARVDLRSRGLGAFLRYLSGYVESPRFVSLASDTHALRKALAAVTYAVSIHGLRVTVGNDEGEPDFGAEVAETFARFRQGAVRGYRVNLADRADMNHVEAQILDRVARLNPAVFEPLRAFRDRHADHLDATIARFDREVQFYLAYLELVGRLRTAGLPFCYPHVSTRSKEIAVRDTFDLALASKLVEAGGVVVCNDFRLEGTERMFVVTGPNNGGKTTFARTFGQLHQLAGLGLPVPGSSARLFLPDRIFTHFEREEDLETLRGKFESELVRVHELLARATGDSVVVLNESFSSTTLVDALDVGTRVMERLLELGPLGVYVTFVDELASLGEATVSMVSQVAPDDPTVRTFKVVRRPADGLAYASAIAEKYGLTYERLVERVGR